MIATNKHTATAWPDFLAAPDASLQDVMQGLEQSQWWTPAALQQGQQIQLSLLLRWAATQVPWYHYLQEPVEKLKHLESEPGLFWELWQTLPILTKEDLRNSAPELHARNLPESHQPVTVVKTSGSTGIPVEVLTTPHTRSLWQALTLREQLWHERDFSKRLGVIRNRPRSNRDPAGHSFSSWGAPVSRLYNTGPASAIHIGYPVDVLARWLTRFNPHYLLAYPSIVGPLMDELSAGDGRPAALEEIRFISEPLDTSLVQRLADEWQVACADIYTCNETGNIAFQCRENGSLHSQSEALLVEILDEQGRPCETGETGRVVVTPLHNLAMPLLRYELGDYATVGAPCPCGRGLPVIQQVLGRVRNLVRTPEGKRYWPTALGKIRSVTPIRQAQYVQTALNTIELRVKLERPLTAEEQQEAIKCVQYSLKYPFHVRIVGVDEIERGPTGKYEEFLSRLTS
ncbi:MAG: phenylacetate--CoA ligase family protein [Gammaproteobacteria bacterium]|nr:phenylacetate--CoA ligase family protein [Gammaproteobacteria bacterium]